LLLDKEICPPSATPHFSVASESQRGMSKKELSKYLLCPRNNQSFHLNAEAKIKNLKASQFPPIIFSSITVIWKSKSKVSSEKFPSYSHQLTARALK
jgi:hypothetical protein